MEFEVWERLVVIATGAAGICLGWHPGKGWAVMRLGKVTFYEAHELRRPTAAEGETLRRETAEAWKAKLSLHEWS